MVSSKIFIFEFISGGGFNKVDMPSSLFCEGFGMLRSIVADFKAIDFEVTLLLDYRISFLSCYLSADIIDQVKAEDNFIRKFKKYVRECEYVFIIAPEFSNTLFNLTKIAYNLSKSILSVELAGIRLGTSKLKTYDHFKMYNIKTPQTYRIPLKGDFVDFDFILNKFNKFNCPIVVKPNDGVGGESIYYLENEESIRNLLQYKNSKIDSNRAYILQKYVDGESLSISLIGHSTPIKKITIDPIILSINSQNINIKSNDSEYYGGYTPVENFKEILKRIAIIIKKVDLSEFNGYYGIDFILKNAQVHFIEINPRLTTSYIGIRNVISTNPADLIFKSKQGEMMTIDLDYSNYSVFSRFDLRYEGDKTIQEIDDNLMPELMKKIPEFITPPITFKKENQEKLLFSCFIATKTRDLKASSKRVNNIIKILEDFGFNVIKGRLLK